MAIRANGGGWRVMPDSMTVRAFDWPDRLRGIGEQVLASPIVAAT